MRTIARWAFAAAAALLFVSSPEATVMVVDVDGTSYSVDVVNAPGGTSEDSTALELTRTTPSGTQTSLIAPTQDPEADRDPFLMVVPGSPGPALIWSRRNGNFDQIAFSKFENQQWSPVQYLTNSSRHHSRPQAGVDAFGTGYVIWVEWGRGGTAILATFEPTTGDLLSSPRDLFRELVHGSSAEFIGVAHSPAPQSRRNRPDSGDITPDTPNDVPAIPPTVQGSTNASLSLSPGCAHALAAVGKGQGLWLVVLQQGSVVQYYRSMVPGGATEDYLLMFLETLLAQNCN